MAWGGTAVVAPGFDFGFSRLVASPFVPSTPAAWDIGSAAPTRGPAADLGLLDFPQADITIGYRGGPVVLEHPLCGTP